MYITAITFEISVKENRTLILNKILSLVIFLYIADALCWKLGVLCQAISILRTLNKYM